MTRIETLPEPLRSLPPVRTLARILEANRLPHALLLKGDAMPVLEQVANALAGSLLFSNKHPTKHPDYFTLRPAKKARLIQVGKRDGAEPNTMRTLLRDLQQTSNQGGYKVAVLHEVDRMNAQAANAFLKTLEEPPPQTVILLLTTRPYDLLPTIRSRCFHFRIPSTASSVEVAGWDFWLRDYQDWIIRLHSDADAARRHPDRPILHMFGLLRRFSNLVDAATEAAWEEQETALPDYIKDDELEALRIGVSKGIRDRLLVEIEEATRIAALRLSHQLPFPALALARAVAELEAITPLLALNMRDDAALECFFLRSLSIWAQ